MTDINHLKEIANNLRISVIKMLALAGSGHTAGALDLADIYSVLYFDHLFINPQNPTDPNRDRVIISNGHTCPILYATLAEKGFFPKSELDTLRQFGSRLQGHPHRLFYSSDDPERSRDDRGRVEGLPPLPGLENTSGSLGQGVSFAVGTAIAVKKLFESGQLIRLPKVYCFVGDGELQEGQVWEAFLSASKFKLNHLTFIVDRNGIQIDGFTEDVMPLESLTDKLKAFGLIAIDIDGHNLQAIKNTLEFDAAYQSKPTAIIAHTIPGKDIDFMEGLPVWHGKPPSIGDTVEALSELNNNSESV